VLYAVPQIRLNCNLQVAVHGDGREIRDAYQHQNRHQNQTLMTLGVGDLQTPLRALFELKDYSEKAASVGGLFHCSSFQNLFVLVKHLTNIDAALATQPITPVPTAQSGAKPIR
jgi:hypothetical protein